MENKIIILKKQIEVWEEKEDNQDKKDVLQTILCMINEIDEIK